MKKKDLLEILNAGCTKEILIEIIILELESDDNKAIKKMLDKIKEKKLFDVLFNDYLWMPRHNNYVLKYVYNNETGDTIAHRLVETIKKYKEVDPCVVGAHTSWFNSIPVLKLTNKAGVSVAELQVRAGWCANRKQQIRDIIKHIGFHIIDLQIKLNKWITNDVYVLNLKDENGVSIKEKIKLERRNQLNGGEN